MKNYLTLQDLAKTSRCKFAAKTSDGWVARRTAQQATHKLTFTLVGGQVDRNQVVCEKLNK